jgi:hypothetical protein
MRALSACIATTGNVLFGFKLTDNALFADVVGCIPSRLSAIRKVFWSRKIVSVLPVIQEQSGNSGQRFVNVRRLHRAIFPEPRLNGVAGATDASRA